MKKKIALVVLSLMMILTVACSKTNNSAEPGGTAPSSAPESSSSATSSETPETADPFGKYDPPITVSTARTVESNMKYEDGDTLENNAWMKLYEDELGIKVKYDWTTPDAASYDQKLTVTIASGALPDITLVNRLQFQELSENDLLEDLTDSYEKYASDLTRKVLESDGGAALASSSLKGRLYGIPIMPSHIDSGHILWVRKDWLQKLNLPEPKTMADVFAISEAFTTKDPDGNNKNDTYGIALTKELYDGYGLQAFFNAYHAYSQAWIQDASGNLVYGSIQPEMKSALIKLSEMYKSGELNKEFAVKDLAKVDEDVASGKVGMTFGAMYLPIGGGIPNNKMQDPQADWMPYAIPSIDDQPAQPNISSGVDAFYVVKKGAKNPEAVVKIMNIAFKIGTFTDAETVETYGNKGDIEKWKYQPVYNNIETNIDKYLTISKALKEQNPDTSKFSGAQATIYSMIQGYKATGEDVFGWAVERIFGEPSSMQLLHNYKENNQFVSNAFYGTPTPSMVSQMPALRKLELEEFTKIIMGASSPDKFDEFVATWKKLGGDQITQEVNEWKNNQ